MSTKIKALIASSMLFAGSAHASDHANKTISVVEVFSQSGSACYFFQLNGVTVADSSISTGPWFAILESQPGAKALWSQLLTARATSMPLARVSTNGLSVCGAAQVSVIDL